MAYVVVLVGFAFVVVIALLLPMRKHSGLKFKRNAG